MPGSRNWMKPPALVSNVTPKKVLMSSYYYSFEFCIINPTAEVINKTFDNIFFSERYLLDALLIIFFPTA